MEELENLRSKIRNIIGKNEVLKLKSEVKVEVTTYCGYDYKLKKDVYRKDTVTIRSISRSKKGSVYLLDIFEQVILPEEVDEKGCKELIKNI